MTIKLKYELIVNSFKTIDDCGVNVHVTGGGCITLKYVSNIIIPTCTTASLPGTPTSPPAPPTLAGATNRTATASPSSQPSREPKPIREEAASSSSNRS
ncbi:hypothetical protein FF1_017451 [Malus domestica]